MIRSCRVAAGLLIAAAGILSGCSDGIDRSRIRNVVVVTLDTTRADHLGCYGYKDVKTPHLDRLASSGVLFDTAIAHAPLTLPSHTSIFTGRYPYRHGVRNNGTFRVPESETTLAEMLRAKGFRTGAVIGAFVLDSKFGLDQGFEEYDDNLSGGRDAPMFMFDERPGRDVTDAGVAWLAKNRTDRFFLWLHYFDVHANYQPPPPYDVLYEDRPYDGEIAGVDAQIGRIVAALRDQGRLDDTLLVVTADHGESLGEHGEATHSLLIYDATVRVPLIFSHPSLPQGTRVGGLARSVDIVPTVLDLAGVPVPAGLDGESLAPWFDGRRPVDREGYVESLVPRFNNGWAELRGLRTADSKYIQAPRPELYDVVRDPGELQNLLPGQDAAAMVARLETHLANDIERTASSGKSALQMSSADRERLRALGYNPDSEPPPASASLPDPKDKIAQWEEFQGAQNLMRDRKYTEAEAALRDVIAKDPGNVMAHSSLGSALAALDRLDEAKVEFETVTKLDPRRNQGRLALARLHRKQGDLPRAFALLKEGLDSADADPDLAVEFADLFQDSGNTDKAVEWYEEALRRDPLHIKAMIGLSNTYHRAGRESDARAALDRVLALEPRNADALYNLAVISEAQGRESEALELYQRALESDPKHVAALNNLGSYYDRKGQVERAEAAYRAVLQADASHFEATYNLGTLLLRAKRAEDALPLLRRALELNPASAQGYNNLAVAYVELGRHEEAAKLLRRLAEADATRPGWWLRLARVEADAGRHKQAREALERALATGDSGVKKRIESDETLRKLMANKKP